MSTTSQNSASSRISALLDDNSFVEIGGSVTARNTDFNLQNKETPADGVLTGYGTIDGALSMFTARTQLFWAVPSEKCTQRRL